MNIYTFVFFLDYLAKSKFESVAKPAQRSRATVDELAKNLGGWLEINKKFENYIKEQHLDDLCDSNYTASVAIEEHIDLARYVSTIIEQK